MEQMQMDAAHAEGGRQRTVELAREVRTAERRDVLLERMEEADPHLLEQLIDAEGEVLIVRTGHRDDVRALAIEALQREAVGQRTRDRQMDDPWTIERGRTFDDRRRDAPHLLEVGSQIARGHPHVLVAALEEDGELAG